MTYKMCSKFLNLFGASIRIMVWWCWPAVVPPDVIQYMFGVSIRMMLTCCCPSWCYILYVCLVPVSGCCLPAVVPPDVIYVWCQYPDDANLLLSLLMDSSPLGDLKQSNQLKGLLNTIQNILYCTSLKVYTFRNIELKQNLNCSGQYF